MQPIKSMFMAVAAYWEPQRKIRIQAIMVAKGVEKPHTRNHSSHFCAKTLKADKEPGILLRLFDLAAIGRALHMRINQG